MPLELPEDAAVFAAVERIRVNGGSSDGVQTYLRRLGAHSEQAKRLTEDAVKMYGTLQNELGETIEPDVQATVEVDGKELNITLKADRLPITSFDELVSFYDIDTEIWHPTSQLFNFWGSKDNPNFQVKANFKKDEYRSASAEDRESFRQWASEYAPTFDLDALDGPTEGRDNLLELVVSDLHVEKYDGTTDSLERMLQELRKGCIDIIMNTLRVSGEIGEVHLVFNGDTFNADNARGTTTKGTQQENTLDFRQVFTRTRSEISLLATAAYQTLNADVYIHIIPGNHDRERSYYLADSLWAFFHNHPRIHVDVTDGFRSYIRWGSTLIGLAHGNDVKNMDLVMSMMREQSMDGIKFPVWHLGHYHTRREEEVHGVLLRWFRTAQAFGEWESAKGYGHNQRDVVGILHHRERGDIAEFRYTFGGNA